MDTDAWFGSGVRACLDRMIDALVGTDYEWDGHGYGPGLLRSTIMGSTYLSIDGPSS